MAKYRDKRAVGRSQLSPFREDEHPAARHSRRLTTAQQTKLLASEWLSTKSTEGISITLDIKNQGHHWIFRLKNDPGPKGTHFAQWWPSSAKLILSNRWNEGIHAHDIQQVIQVLEEQLRKRNDRSNSQGSAQTVSGIQGETSCNQARPNEPYGTVLDKQTSHPEVDRPAAVDEAIAQFKYEQCPF